MELAFRYPKGVVDTKALRRYAAGHTVGIRSTSRDVIVAISVEGDGENFETADDGSSWLSSLIALRARDSRSVRPTNAGDVVMLVRQKGLQTFLAFATNESIVAAIAHRGGRRFATAPTRRTRAEPRAGPGQRIARSTFGARHLIAGAIMPSSNARADLRR
ncbi:MAG: hypothetical protein DMF89_02250 [Acidobacteria bacterium]|nr:MAG: hypothetical protein DMF89_02250 [Acidobacteriota bacterium]